MKNGSGLLGPVAGGCGQVSASTWRGGRRLSESGMPQRSARNLAGLGLFFPEVRRPGLPPPNLAAFKLEHGVLSNGDPPGRDGGTESRSEPLSDRSRAFEARGK